MISSRINRRSLVRAGGAAATLGLGLRYGATLAQDTAETITMYAGQHESLALSLADGFTSVTGIGVDVRSGKDSELANQIIEEGDRSHADVFITEEPGPMAMLDGRELLAPVDASTLALTDARFNAESGNWMGYAARSRVMFFNPEIISEDELPTSVMDFVNDDWKGRFSYAPSGAFVSTTVYLINTIGEEETLNWLKGIQANGENLLKNGAVRDAVEAGQIGIGLSNHYYWYILARENGGEDNMASRVHWVSGQDAGGLMLASGAGILKTSQKQEAAQQFVAWLADIDGGQKIIAEETPQFPVAPGVESSYNLPALDSLDPPVFDQGSLKDGNRASELLVEAGII